MLTSSVPLIVVCVIKRWLIIQFNFQSLKITSLLKNYEEETTQKNSVGHIYLYSLILLMRKR